MTDTPTREQAIDALATHLTVWIAEHFPRFAEDGCECEDDFGDEDAADCAYAMVEKFAAHLSAHPEQVAALGLEAGALEKVRGEAHHYVEPLIGWLRMRIAYPDREPLNQQEIVDRLTAGLDAVDAACGHRPLRVELAEVKAEIAAAREQPDPDPLAHVKVGDPDPTLKVDITRWCCAVHPDDLVCTREKGHSDTWRHIAGGFGEGRCVVLAVWPAQPETGATA